jgi:hypothetical protein
VGAVRPQMAHLAPQAFGSRINLHRSRLVSREMREAARYTRSKESVEVGRVMNDGKEEGVSFANLVVGLVENAGAGRLWVLVGYVEGREESGI